MLYYKLPFYGKRGSIGEIKESKAGFEVLVYNIDGKNNNIITIRNTSNNKRELLANFFSDVEEYLFKYQNKFLELRNKEQKNVLDKKMAMVILVVSILLGIGVPVVNILLGSSSMLSVISLMIGAAFSTASIISLKNGKENDETEEFLKKYSNLSHELKIYKEERKMLSKENKNVKSRSLSPSTHDKDKNSTLIKSRKQELERINLNK